MARRVPSQVPVSSSSLLIALLDAANGIARVIPGAGPAFLGHLPLTGQATIAATAGTLAKAASQTGALTILSRLNIAGSPEDRFSDTASTGRGLGAPPPRGLKG